MKTPFGMSVLLLGALNCFAAPSSDQEIATQFLYCTGLDAYFEQMSKKDETKKKAKASGTLNVAMAKGLTSWAFVDDQLPRAMDKFQLEYVTQQSLGTLDSFIQRTKEDCLQVLRDHGQRALQQFGERAKGKQDAR